MKKNNLIISVVGDNSYHKEWIKDKCDFDLILIYYGDNNDIYNDYKKDSLICIKNKGNFFPLVKKFIDDNIDIINKYDYIWLPDDDISISTNQINNLFKISSKYDIFICQPSVKSDFDITYKITEPVENNILRYTNFVECMAPLFNTDILMLLYDDFEISESGWGLDISWYKRLNYPKNKIAIIDDVTMIHKKPCGIDYNRFQNCQDDDFKNIVKKYNILDAFNFIVYEVVKK